MLGYSVTSGMSAGRGYDLEPKKGPMFQMGDDIQRKPRPIAESPEDCNRIEKRAETVGRGETEETENGGG